MEGCAESSFAEQAFSKFLKKELLKTQFSWQLYLPAL